MRPLGSQPLLGKVSFVRGGRGRVELSGVLEYQIIDGRRGTDWIVMSSHFVVK